jgi:hypothetical protein
MDATNHHSSANIDVQYSLYKSDTITATAIFEWRNRHAAERKCCYTYQKTYV